MALIDQALAFVRSRKDQHRAELESLVSIPSISTDPAHTTDVRVAAQWLADWIGNEGGASELIDTDGHPLVWGEFPTSVAGAPTVLLYGHYDVQPVDPIELWDSDPFSPRLEDDRLYGRGASDMKAQLLAALFAIRALRSAGDLPVRIRVLFEGEEEIGSPNLVSALHQHGDRFTADYCLNPDVGMLGPDTPTIRYGLRGLAYFELHVTGPERDLHSGAFGGVVHNPAQALAEIVAGMHDQNGTVTLPGFYDKVREIDHDEKARLAGVPFDEAVVRELSGVRKVWGEPDFTPTERVSARPTLEINGITGGYTGPGAKTVIPARAMAKISTRLVPDQRSEDVRKQLEAYLAENAPPTIDWELRELAGGAPFICSPESPAHTALSASLEEVWGVKPALSRSGGSVPVASELQEILGIPSLLTGFALPDDKVHSPNESQHLPTWYRGIEALVRFFGSSGSA